MPRRPFDSQTAHVADWLAETGTGLQPDREPAERFLRALDPGAEFFSFRTFSDTPYSRVPGKDPLEHAIHGSLQACWARLVELNRRGAAIAVTINATDGRARSVPHIQRVRALFVDDDRPDPARPVFPLAPHILVRSSPGRYHRYWLVRGVSRQSFTGLQAQLARFYNADLKVCALNHAMGVPGFWRRKRATVWRLTRLLSVSGARPFENAEFEGIFDHN